MTTLLSCISCPISGQIYSPTSGYVGEWGNDPPAWFIDRNRKLDAQGRLSWDAQWMHTDKGLKGGWFIVRVQMDKTVALIPGK